MRVANEIREITALDVQGKKILHRRYDGIVHVQFEVSSQAFGLYLINIETKEAVLIPYVKRI